ncbi:MAG: NifU N-terminal domain-containing protein, partial [Elusimicrobiota bacterium]
MNDDISARLTSDWTSCRFTLSKPVHQGGAVFFPSKEQASGSPLVENLFRLPGVTAVKVSQDAVTVTREDAEDWPK